MILTLVVCRAGRLGVFVGGSNAHSYYGIYEAGHSCFSLSLLFNWRISSGLKRWILGGFGLLKRGIVDINILVDK